MRKLILGERKPFERVQQVFEGLMGIIQREGFHLLTFLVEKKVAIGFSRELV